MNIQKRFEDIFRITLDFFIGIFILILIGAVFFKISHWVSSHINTSANLKSGTDVYSS